MRKVCLFISRTALFILIVTSITQDIQAKATFSPRNVQQDSLITSMTTASIVTIVDLPNKQATTDLHLPTLNYEIFVPELSGLKKGTYIVEVKTTYGIQAFKLIVE